MIRDSLPARAGGICLALGFLLSALPAAVAETPPVPPDGGPTPTPLHTDVIFLDVIQAKRGVALYEHVIGLNPGAHISVGKDPRSIVAHDHPDRLSRFRVLVSMLDRGDPKDRLYVRPVVHATPSRLATILLDVMNPKARRSFILVPDDRAKKLVFRCQPKVYARLDKLIRRLDVPAREERKVRVVPKPEGT